MSEPFKIEAIVKSGASQYYVLNRPPQFLYRREGKYLLAEDGPFRSTYGLAYMGSMKAFAGAVFDIPLIDGTVEKASGQWWDVARPEEETVSAPWGTVEGLTDCYVFRGGSANADELAALIADYKGEVYPYWAYQALIYLPVANRKRRAHEVRADRIAANAKALKKQVRTSRELIHVLEQDQARSAEMLDAANALIAPYATALMLIRGITSLAEAQRIAREALNG